MARRVMHGLPFWGGLVSFAMAVWVVAGLGRIEGRAAARPAPAPTSAGSASIDTQRVIRYIREKFGVPDTVKLQVGPLETSPVLPGYYHALVAVDYGEQNKAQNTQQSVLVSKDDHYLVVGSALPLKAANSKTEIGQRVREMFKVPENMQVTVGAPHASTFAPFSQFQVTVDDGKGKKQNMDLYLAQSGRVLVLGQIYLLGIDPRIEALRTISTQDQPGVGPANAPVTIVEYADLQCPTCAQLHEFIEKSLLPKYGDKIHFIFKEFPLPLHDWSMQAAVANECAYQLDPSTFVNYRSLIFARQTSFTVANVRDLLLQYGQEAGIDRLRLSACLDSKASLRRIDADKREAEKLGVSRTPTSFINGRLVVGMPPADDFYKMVDAALAEKPEKRVQARR